MDYIKEIFNFLIDYIKNNPVATITWFIGICTTIVGATKTDKDDKALNFIIKILDTFSLLNPRGTVTIRIDEKKNNGEK